MNTKLLMNWFHGIVLGGMLVVMLMNGALLSRVSSAREHLQKESADLEKQYDDLIRLAGEVTQKSDELKALAETLPHCKPNGKPAARERKAADEPEPAAAEALSQCAVIHYPKRGCPKGYAQAKWPRFIERDGSRLFACVSEDRAKQSCIDELRPGESMEMHIIIPIVPG